MQSVLTSVSNPVWSDEAHTRIDCVITMDVFGEEPLPFTANKYDIEPHGRAIFERIVSGVYGDIAPYAPPPASTATAPSGLLPTEVL
jgi:hypothetical protein